MKRPIYFLMHPVGDGPTRSMNVLSTKLWIRALVEALPDVVISAPWLPYAEVMIDRDRGMRDAMASIDVSHAVIAAGGDFTPGMQDEWNYAARSQLSRVDLTRRPFPGILTYETFADTRTPGFRHAISTAFESLLQARAA